MPVKIISDSTCDLSEDLLKEYDIAIVPLTVTLGDRSGHDGVDITPEDIYAYVEETGVLPKSSAVSVGEYKEAFGGWREKGYEIVHFSLSAKFSASWQNACTAAEELGGVHVVDSANLSTGQGLLTLYGAELAEDGKSAAEIAEACRSLAGRVEASFVINTTDYLHKGGRCSALMNLGANLLHIKPCIEVRDGGMHPGKKYHGSINHAIHAYVEDRLKNRADIDLKRMFITHTRVDPQAVDDVRSLIEKHIPGIEEILETTAGATITTHCGPDTLGILFVRKAESAG